VILANFLIGVLLRGYVDGLSSEAARLRTYLDSLASGLNGYLQFAGYSDIAIGTGLLLGFRVIENFNNPFLSSNISEFWRRWHISLSSWCRQYIFDVVVSIARRPYLAALITMVAIGLWHEISLRYILWGAWHAAGIVVWQAYQGLKQNQQPPGSALARRMTHVAGIVVTFHFVIFSFILVNKPSLGDSFAAYRALLLG
jgi:alginate O-acetyltransferase complex protein AlgI